MYRKKRRIVLVIFAVLYVAVIIYSVVMQQRKKTQLVSQGIVSIDNDEEALAEARTRGGKIYLHGPLEGEADLSRLDIGSLEISGPEGERRLRVAERSLTGTYLYAEAQVCYMEPKTITDTKRVYDKVRDEYVHEEVRKTVLVPEPRDSVDVWAPRVSILGLEIPLSRADVEGMEMDEWGDTEHAKEEVVRLRTVSTGALAWFELELRDGAVVEDSVRRLADQQEIYDAKVVAGSNSIVGMLLGGLLVVSIPLAIVLYLLKRKYGNA